MPNYPRPCDYLGVGKEAASLECRQMIIIVVEFD